jgi:hypothetical protein
MGVAGLLALANAKVLISRGSPAKFLPNYVGWDLAPGTSALNLLPGWLRRVADGWVPPRVNMNEFRGAGNFRAEMAERLGLSRVLDDFTRLPDCAARELGLAPPVFALAWNADAIKHTGIWGEVSVPLDEEME